MFAQASLMSCRWEMKRLYETMPNIKTSSRMPPMIARVMPTASFL